MALGMTSEPYGSAIWHSHIAVPYGTAIWHSHMAEPYGTAIWQSHMATAAAAAAAATSICLRLSRKKLLTRFLPRKNDMQK